MQCKLPRNGSKVINLMTKNLDFLLFEIKILHQVRAISILLFSFQTISMLTLPFLLDSKDIEFYAPQILVFCIALSIIITSSNNLSADKLDGSLVQKLLIFEYFDIVIVKQLSMFLLSALISLMISIMIWLLYSLSFLQFFFFLAASLLVLIISCSLAFCSSVIKLYFDNNTEYLSMIMMPLLIPFFICASIAITSCNYFYLLLMLGMNLILAPIISLMSIYLMRDIY